MSRKRVDSLPSHTIVYVLCECVTDSKGVNTSDIPGLYVVSLDLGGCLRRFSSRTVYLVVQLFVLEPVVLARSIASVLRFLKQLSTSSPRSIQDPPVWSRNIRPTPYEWSLRIRSRRLAHAGWTPRSVTADPKLRYLSPSVRSPLALSEVVEHEIPSGAKCRPLSPGAPCSFARESSLRARTVVSFALVRAEVVGTSRDPGALIPEVALVQLSILHDTLRKSTHTYVGASTERPRCARIRRLFSRSCWVEPLLQSRRLLHGKP